MFLYPFNVRGLEEKKYFVLMSYWAKNKVEKGGCDRIREVFYKKV